MGTTNGDFLPFLRQNAGHFYCALCLARASQLHLHQLGDAWARLVTDRTVQITEGYCVQCMQVKTVACVKRSAATAV